VEVGDVGQALVSKADTREARRISRIPNVPGRISCLESAQPGAWQRIALRQVVRWSWKEMGATRFRRKLSRPGGMPGATRP
jgi:hypothetical protein